VSFHLSIAVCKSFCKSFDLCFDDDERLFIECFIFVLKAFVLHYSHTTSNMLHHVFATRLSSYYLYVLFVYLFHHVSRHFALHRFQSTPSSK